MKAETKTALGVGFLFWLLSLSGGKKSKSQKPELGEPITPDVKGLYYGKLVSPEFQAAVVELAKELGFEANDLMTLFRIERGLSKDGKRLGPGVYDKYRDKDGVLHKGKFGYGLFGIQPATAFWLGTTPEAIYKMNDLEQLELVKKYFTKHGWAKGGKHDLTGYPRFGEHTPGKLTQFDQMYSGVFYGQRMVDAPLSEVLIDKEKEPEKYQKNIQSDVPDPETGEPDGKITKKDVLIIARRFRKAGAKSRP